MSNTYLWYSVNDLWERSVSDERDGDQNKLSSDVRKKTGWWVETEVPM